MKGGSVRGIHGGVFATARRVGLSPVQHCEIRDLFNGVGVARPIGKQALAARYGVAMADISYIVSPDYQGPRQSQRPVAQKALLPKGGSHPYELTPAVRGVLNRCIKGELSQGATAILLGISRKTVARALERMADEKQAEAA